MQSVILTNSLTQSVNVFPDSAILWYGNTIDSITGGYFKQRNTNSAYGGDATVDLSKGIYVSSATRNALVFLLTNNKFDAGQYTKYCVTKRNNSNNIIEFRECGFSVKPTTTTVWDNAVYSAGSTDAYKTGTFKYNITPNTAPAYWGTRLYAGDPSSTINYYDRIWFE